MTVSEALGVYFNTALTMVGKFKILLFRKECLQNSGICHDNAMTGLRQYYLLWPGKHIDHKPTKSTAARMVTRTHNGDHITPTMNKLH